MGYTTDFSGSFKLDHPLTVAHLAYLKAFAGTRRMQRNAVQAEALPDPVRLAAGLPIGFEGAYFVGSTASFGQDHTADIVNFNRPPQGQPGLWCQWTPDDHGTEIGWDGGEKFYDYIEWIGYLIENFLKPWGYVLNGAVIWGGEDHNDTGQIVITDNVVQVRKARVSYSAKSSAVLLLILVSAVSGFAQNIKPIHMPAAPKGHYYAPKAARVQMPKPGPTKSYIPIFKAVKIPPPRFK